MKHTDPLLRAFHATKHALSKDDRRPSLLYFRVETRDEKTYVVATDGHRLSVRTLPNDFVVPYGSSYYGAESLRVETPDDLVCEKMDFPDWQRVVPAPDGDCRVRVNRKRLIAAVIVARDLMTADIKMRRAVWNLAAYPGRPKPFDAPAPGIVLRLDGAALYVETRCGFVDDMSIAISSSIDYVGPSVNPIGINAQYLLGALKSIRTTDVTVQVTDHLAPIRIDGGDGETEIIMPMRL